MTISELDKAIRPSMRGVFLFYGEEEYLKARYREKLRQTLLPEEGLAPFNHALLTDPAALASEIRTLPMLADRRLVEVSDLSFSSLNKDALEELVTLLSDPGDTVVLFYTRGEEFQAGTAKKPSELYKKLSGVAAIVEFARQTPSRLAAWAARHFAANGTFAPPELCHALIERCGTDMNVLACEIAKLSAYALSQGKKEIDRAMLARVVTPYRESGAFDFVNAIMERDTERAFALFSEKKSRREKPVEIAASVSRVLSELLLVKTLTEAGMSASEIARETKLHEYAVKLRQNSLKNRSLAELVRAVTLCYETDIKLKSRSVDKYFLIERLILTMSGVG